MHDTTTGGKGNALKRGAHLTYRQKSKLLETQFFSDAKFIEKDMLDVIKRANKVLKKISSIKTRADFELSEYESSSYPRLLWQDEYVFKFYFFVTMLGFIDARVDDCDRKIRLFSNSVDYDEYACQQVAEFREIKAMFLVLRDEVVSGYKSVNIVSNSNRFDKMVDTVPCYKKFSDLYSSSKKDKFQLSLQQEFVNAYNVGFIDYDGNASEKINFYREQFKSLSEHLKSDKAYISSINGSKIKKKNEK